MSSSSKKKLRAEENAAKLTERQLQQRKEDQKVRLYTIAFAVGLALLVIVAAVIGVSRAVSNSGIRERKTIAAYLGDDTMSNAELGFYFSDTVNNFYSQNSSYLALFGLDATKPLDQQVFDSGTGETWADYFLTNAAESAKSTYALTQAAAANDFVLPQEYEDQIASVESSLSLYASLYGFSDAEDYLKAMYGNGATLESYRKYLRDSMTAAAYQDFYQDSLTFTADDVRARDNEHPLTYNSYSYNQYYLGASRYLDDNATPEQKAAAAEADAKAITGENIQSVADMDAAIAALAINADSSDSSTAMENTRYEAMNDIVAQWVSDSSRKAGDKTYLPVSTTTVENGAEVTNVTGYYALYFLGATDNKTPMANVRHILVDFDGDETEAGKAAAKQTAEEILAQWQQGEATEESFAALASEKSHDTGSQDNGGLYENVYPGQMVSAFNNWCFDSVRKPGDTGIVETSYGYHVMYYVGQSQQLYRDYLIENDLRSEAYETWYQGLVDGVTLTLGDTSYIRTDLVLNSNS